MAGSMESVEDRLRRYIREEIGASAEIADDDKLVEKGFVASVRLLDLVGFIEDEWGVELSPRDVVPENLATIAAMARMIRARQTG